MRGFLTIFAYALAFVALCLYLQPVFGAESVGRLGEWYCVEKEAVAQVMLKVKAHDYRVEALFQTYLNDGICGSARYLSGGRPIQVTILGKAITVCEFNLPESPKDVAYYPQDRNRC